MESSSIPFCTKLLCTFSFAAAFVAINIVALTGLFGLPTNKELSEAYPSHIMPAGFACWIWAVIFILQALGLLGIACGAVPAASAKASLVPWISTWILECMWQGVFFTAPVPARSATESVRLSTLVPATMALVGAAASMLTAGMRLRMREVREDDGGALSQLISAIVIDFPTGMNAGWLAAASCVSCTRVFDIAAPAIATEQGAAAIVTALSVLAAIVAVACGSSLKSLGAGLGYAAVTAWACLGVAKADGVPSLVETAASGGMYIASVGGLVALATAAVSRCCISSDKYKGLLPR